MVTIVSTESMSIKQMETEGCIALFAMLTPMWKGPVK